MIASPFYFGATMILLAISLLLRNQRSKGLRLTYYVSFFSGWALLIAFFFWR